MIKNENKQRQSDWNTVFEDEDGFDLEEVDIKSHVRKSYPSSRAPSSKYRMIAISFACFVTLLLIVSIVLFNKINTLQNEADSMESEIQDLEHSEKNIENSIKQYKGHLSDPDEDGDQENIVLLNFDPAKLKNQIKVSRSMLENYYQGKDVLTQSIFLKPGEPKYEKGLDYIVDKMARALLWGDKFIISAMGSSVTAGHDNCNYDSYEKQLERLMAPLWKTAGVKFEVRNAGEGGGCGDTYTNQVWCMRNILGDDTDIAHYSWSYFEAGHRDAIEYHEMFIRWALMMRHAPVPQFFTPGGEKGAASCGGALDASGHLFDMYGEFGVNVVCLQTGILQHGYKGKVWAAIGDGMHKTTRYGESESEERKKSLGVVFRNWHPGPLGFQVTADTFGYYYMDAMLRALVKIKNTEKELWPILWPKKPKVLSKLDLPKPRYCNAEICSLDEPPGCHNFEKPTFGRPQIHVIPPTDDMNPYRSHAKAGDLGWEEWSGETSPLIPKAEKNDPKCEHLDACGGIRGVGRKAGWLTLVLPRMVIGRILVCCPHGKHCADLLLTSKIVFVFDGNVVPTKNLKITWGKCLQVQEKFLAPLDDPNGHLHLGVWINSSDTIDISHVIAV